MKLLFSLLTLLSLCLPSSAAFDVFIRFDEGLTVKGKSQHPVYSGNNGWSELLNFSFGIENNVSVGSLSAGGGSGHALFQHIRLSKTSDSMSAHLFEKCAQGRHFEKVELVICGAGGTTSKDTKKIMELDLRFVMVQSVQIAGSNGDASVEEEITFLHGSQNIKFYTPSPITGNVVLAGEATWSIIKNTDSL